MKVPLFKAEPMYSLRGAQEKFFPGRSPRWVKDKAKAGAFGDVVRDDGGWLIPESGIIAYLERYRVGAAATEARPEQRTNLVQFQS